MAEDSRGARDWGGEETMPGPDADDGSHRVEERPPDEPGPGRGAGFLLVAILAALLLLIPVLWGIGMLGSLGDVLGGAPLGVLGLLWGLVLVGVLAALWGMWRRSG